MKKLWLLGALLILGCGSSVNPNNPKTTVVPMDTPTPTPIPTCAIYCLLNDGGSMSHCYTNISYNPTNGSQGGVSQILSNYGFGLVPQYLWALPYGAYTFYAGSAAHAVSYQVNSLAATLSVTITCPGSSITGIGF